MGEIKRLEKENKKIQKKYKKLKHDARKALGSGVNQEFHDFEENAETELMSEAERVKLEMINELRYIFDEPELQSPKTFNESGFAMEDEFKILQNQALCESSSSDSGSSVGDPDLDQLKNTVCILKELIEVNNRKGTHRTELDRINNEMSSICDENIQLRDDIRKREDTIQNLIFRYSQCEQKVRDFIKNTLRTIMEKQKRIKSHSNDHDESQTFHL